jgi:hypothetical protein
VLNSPSFLFSSWPINCPRHVPLESPQLFLMPFSDTPALTVTAGFSKLLESLALVSLFKYLDLRILWHVMPLKTPFRLLIGFITILQVVTTITYNTVTYLHSLHANLFSLSAVVFAYSVSLSLKHLNSLHSSSHTNFP